ncbi:MAG: histidine kinase [Bacteroidota bacterium]|nr:histidine kinase [Bacteroidota bacterium]
MFSPSPGSFSMQRLSRVLLPGVATLFFLLTFSFSARAQSFNFRNYSVDDGLPFVQVYTIYQDSKGYLWSGGYGGLSRFDGKTFTNFSPRNGLPNYWVTSIMEDIRGDLWVGTIKGASRYKDGEFENFTVKDGLPGNYVNCLLRDERDVLWVGTANGVCRHNGEKFLSFGNEGPGDKSILCLYQEPNTARIWMGTTNGVYVFANNKFTFYALPAGINSAVTAISQDMQGRILAGSNDGLLRLENGHFGLILTPAGIDMPAVSSMITDRDGITWIGANNGLFSFDGQTFTPYRVSPDVNASTVGCLYIDYESSLWLGTHRGLFRFRGNGFTSYGEQDGLTSPFIFGITKDTEGNIWSCSQNKGLFKYDPTTTSGNAFTIINKSKGLPSDITYAAITMPNGDLFFGSAGGLTKISKGVMTNYNRKDGLYCDSVNCFMIDHSGRLWMAGGKTLTIMEKDGSFTGLEVTSAPGEKFDIWALHEDRTGKIWIGSYPTGLFSYDGQTFTDEKKKLNLSPDDYFQICEDKDGRIYFGTLGGVFIYDGKSLDSLTVIDGLSSELIYCMVMDNKTEHLWIGTNQGLSRFDVLSYRKNKSKNITTYGEEEGFTGVESNSNGTYLDESGQIWFGTVNGLIRYSPENFRNNPAYAKTSITGMRLFYNDTLLTADQELGYADNNISFEYVGICLTNPSKVRYRYKLSGWETEYSPPTPDRVARYSNLPPGKYIFNVISCNNEGLWTPEPASFSFVIQTPVWKRPWFWLLLTCIAIFILSASIVYRIRQIKKKERAESESRVAMAGNELKALRAQMNPHFVFNSLNSIQHFILTNKSADAGKYLNKFARLMRVILNNSEKSLITIREELEYLQLYLDLEEMRFEGKFISNIHIADGIDIDYLEIPAMLLQPYVENAILHGLTPKQGGGKLDISMRLKANTIICSITDNGIGREKAREMRQLSNRKDHKSLGMKITHDRLELINRLNGSQLSLTITDLYSEDGSAAGTRVDIFIPVS